MVVARGRHGADTRLGGVRHKPVETTCGALSRTATALYVYAGCLARISPASPDEVKPKVVLTMAAPWEESAADFNMQSDEYYIKVKDYSEGGEFDTATAYTRMLTDIACREQRRPLSRP